jgi:hypothetical protein
LSLPFSAATVTLTHLATKSMHEYSISIEAAGFMRFAQRGVVLDDR